MLKTITFEIVVHPDGEPLDLFGDATTREESLHEALCQAIHEQNADAIQWLTSNISDIQ